MYRRGDPRWNRTIQHISENLEHANETAAENLYGFTQRYVNPCVASLTNCCNAVTSPCFPSSNDRRRSRARSRGRAERNFDFYDDWDDDNETDGLLGGWGSDNLERFLGSAATYGTTTQPNRQRAMSYTQRARDPRFDPARRKSTAQAHNAQDPTLIPSSSYFGFLSRLPFKLPTKALRYKPSAADLTEHPGARRNLAEEQPLIEDSGEDVDVKPARRARSGTHTSGHTTDSFSSRGDIFPSEDELDDAVPLDDEFTIALERRVTGVGDDSTSGTRSGSRRPRRSASGRTVSSGVRSVGGVVVEEGEVDGEGEGEGESGTPGQDLDALEREEEQLRRDEDAQLQQNRILAHHLAVQRGLASPTHSPTAEQHPPPQPQHTAHPDVAQTVEDDANTATSPPLSPDTSRPATAIRRAHDPAFVPARLPDFGGAD